MAGNETPFKIIYYFFELHISLYCVFKVSPLEEGQLTVYLHDACLDADGPADTRLILSDVYSLQLTVPDKVRFIFVLFIYNSLYVHFIFCYFFVKDNEFVLKCVFLKIYL